MLYAVRRVFKLACGWVEDIGVLVEELVVLVRCIVNEIDIFWGSVLCYRGRKGVEALQIQKGTISMVWGKIKLC